MAHSRFLVPNGHYFLLLLSNVQSPVKCVVSLPLAWPHMSVARRIDRWQLLVCWGGGDERVRVRASACVSETDKRGDREEREREESETDWLICWFIDWFLVLKEREGGRKKVFHTCILTKCSEPMCVKDNISSYAVRCVLWTIKVYLIWICSYRHCWSVSAQKCFYTV